MGFLDKLFGREKGPRDKGKELAPLIFQVATSEMLTLSHLWQVHLSDFDQVRFVVEYSSILLSHLDRIALGSMGPTNRSDFTNEVIDRLSHLLSKQPHFGATRDERVQYLESFFVKRLNHYGQNKDLGQFAAVCAKHLFDQFCKISSSENSLSVLKHTSEHLVHSLVALNAVPNIKELYQSK